MNKQEKNDNFFLQQGKMTEKARIIMIFRSWYQMYRGKFPLRFEAEVTK